MVEKILDTRIQLKYDSYENWTNEKLGEGKGANLILKKGEIGICEIPSGNTTATTAPTVLFKVGDGTLPYHNSDPSKCLKWASALAADVYEWAKQSTLFVQKEGNGNVVSGITWDATLNDGRGGIKFTTAAVATAEGLKELQDEVYGADGSASNSRIDKIEKDIADNRAGWEKNDNTTYTITETDKGFIFTPSEGEAKTITFAYLTAEEIAELNHLVAGDITTGSENGTIAVEGTNVAVKGLQDAAYTTVESLNATAKGYADAVEAKLPTIAKGDDTITIEGTAKNPTVKVTPNTFDAYGAAAQALEDAKAYADMKPHDNTAHTHVNGKGIKVDNAGGISGEVKADLNVAFELVDKTIKLYDKDDSSKTAIATLDASEFIADGMLASVTADQDNNKLVFEWNTDAGVTKTEIPLSSIADIYTGRNGDEVNVSVSNTNEISASLNSAIATKVDHGETAYGWGNHASAGYAANADLTKVINGTTPVAKATDADTLGGQVPSYYATAASVTEITKDNGTIDTKIDAYNTSKNFGDIITRNANEFAPSDIDTGVHSVALASGANNGTLKLTVDGTATDNIAVTGLKSAAFTDSTDYATAAQGALADTAVQGVTNVADNGLVMTKGADNTLSVDWDPNIVFVFNCGTSTEVI